MFENPNGLKYEKVLQVVIIFHPGYLFHGLRNILKAPEPANGKISGANSAASLMQIPPGHF